MLRRKLYRASDVARAGGVHTNTTAHLPTDTPLWINPDLMVEALD